MGGCPARGADCSNTCYNGIVEVTQERNMAIVEYLSTERETYARAKPRLVTEAEGKYVLIHGPTVCGVWNTYEDAIEAGYDAYEPGSFMVKKIERDETVHFVRCFPCP